MICINLNQFVIQILMQFEVCQFLRFSYLYIDSLKVCVIFEPHVGEEVSFSDEGCAL